MDRVAEATARALADALRWLNEPRRARTAADAIRAEYDEDQVICRGCGLVLDRTPALDAMDERPLCGPCLRDEMETRGGEA